MDGKRIFLAIDISDAARTVCSSHIDSLRNEFPQVRVGWERSEKLHVTLKFLGPTPPDRLGELSHRVADVASNYNPFMLRLGVPGSFPSRGKPRVLWIGTNGAADDLIRLQSDVEKACESLGYDREEKPFHPHITIGRVRDHRDAYVLAEAHRKALIEPVEFEISHVVIYESKLLSSGSVYSRVASPTFSD
jgi:2'-5' RNA ligase